MDCKARCLAKSEQSIDEQQHMLQSQELTVSAERVHRIQTQHDAGGAGYGHDASLQQADWRRAWHAHSKSGGGAALGDELLEGDEQLEQGDDSECALELAALGCNRSAGDSRAVEFGNRQLH